MNYDSAVDIFKSILQPQDTCLPPLLKVWLDMRNQSISHFVILFDFTQYTGVPYRMSCEKLIEYRMLCSRAGVSPNTDLASFEADHEETM